METVAEMWARDRVYRFIEQGKRDESRKMSKHTQRVCNVSTILTECACLFTKIVR